MTPWEVVSDMSPIAQEETKVMEGKSLAWGCTIKGPRHCCLGALRWWS